MIGHDANTGPTSGEKGGNPLPDFLQESIKMFGQLPATVMAVMIDVATFAPGVALTVSGVSALKLSSHRPPAVS